MFKWLLTYLMKYWKHVLVFVGLSIVTSVITQSIPKFIQHFIDVILPSRDMGALLGLIGLLAGLLLLKKNQLMTENGSAFSNAVGNSTVGGTVKQHTDSVQQEGPVTEARAIEMGSQALSSMIGIDLSRNNLTHDAVKLRQRVRLKRVLPARWRCLTASRTIAINLSFLSYEGKLFAKCEMREDRFFEICS